MSLLKLVLSAGAAAAVVTCSAGVYAASACAQTAATPALDAGRTVERMRGMSMIAQAGGAPTERELRRRDITQQLHALGQAAVRALVDALRDPDVQMRQNAALALIALGGGYSMETKPALDSTAALPGLIEATRDPDRDVRGWSAHAIAEMGSAAMPAIPVLLTLLDDPEEGPRNTACIALGRIGPAARDALPALRTRALGDPSLDVRNFARLAIQKIEGK